MEIKIKTLTPIWTGGVNPRTCDRIHETGIIGSLRWWYEAIVRGLGGYACDPTEHSSNACKDKEHCPVCDMFGCTGWGRKFRLEIEDGAAVFRRDNPLHFPSRRRGGWYLGSGRQGENIKIMIVPLRGGNDVENILKVPLYLASKWGGLGARTQMGFGVVELFDEKNKLFTANFNEFIVQHTNSVTKCKKGTNNPNVPDLKNFFFAKFHILNPPNKWWENLVCWKGAWNKSQESALTTWGKINTIPIAPDIKDVLRYYGFIPSFGSDKDIGENKVAKYICGTIRGDKIASKINISSAYLVGDNQWEFRIWGWIPDNLTDRSTVIAEIYAALNNASFWEEVFGANYVKMICWREKEQGVPGGRCTGTCSNIYVTGEDFLKCLLQ